MKHTGVEAWLPFCLVCLALALGNYAYRNGALGFLSVARQFRRRDQLEYVLRRIIRQFSMHLPNSTADSSNRSKIKTAKTNKSRLRTTIGRRLSDSIVIYSVSCLSQNSGNAASSIKNCVLLSVLSEILPCLKQLKSDQIVKLGEAFEYVSIAKAELLPSLYSNVIFIDDGLIDVKFGNCKDSLELVDSIPSGELLFSALALLRRLYGRQRVDDDRLLLRCRAASVARISCLPFEALLSIVVDDGCNALLKANCWRYFHRVVARGLAPLLLPEAPAPWLGELSNTDSSNIKLLEQGFHECNCTAMEYGAGEGVTAEANTSVVVVEAGAGQLGELIRVLRGCLWQRVNGHPVLVGRPGDLVGQLDFLSRLPLGSAGEIYCHAGTPTRIERFSLPIGDCALETSLAKKFLNYCLSTVSSLPIQLEPVARLLSLSSGQLLPVDNANASSNCCYYVLSGRLRDCQDSTANNWDENFDPEHQGDVVVARECYTRGCLIKPDGGLEAARDSELIRLSRQMVDYLSLRCPAFSHRLVSVVAHRLLDSYHPGAAAVQPSASADCYSVVALLPGQPRIPVELFVEQLAACLPGIVRWLSWDRACQSVTSSSNSCLGADQASPGSADDILRSWLAEQEDSATSSFYSSSPPHKLFLLLSLDQAPTHWTRACLRRADTVLVLCEHADMNVPPSLAELHCRAYNGKKQIELLLLHSRRRQVVPAGSTLPYLLARPWLTGHRHLRLPVWLRRVARSSGKSAADWQFNQPPPPADLRRLARHLSASALGLALGGGGARGAAHPAVLGLLANRGVPVDAVAGTSIGALVGALCSMNTCPEFVQQTVKRLFFDASRKSSQALDVTLPLVSLFRGGLLNRLLAECFDAKRGIEDLWLPCYIIATELRSRRIRILNRGLLWKAVRASMSYPVLLPPVWSDDGRDCLVDGCFVNNLPVDVLRSRTADGVANKIVAVDISDSNRLEPGRFRVYGDSLSGFAALLSPRGRYPRLIDVQMRLASITSNMRVTKQRLRAASWCWYLTPPVQDFGIASFTKFHQVYQAAVRYLDEKWQRDSAEGALPHWLLAAVNETAGLAVGNHDTLTMIDSSNCSSARLLGRHHQIRGQRPSAAMGHVCAAGIVWHYS